MTKLSILIPSLHSRAHLLKELRTIIHNQMVANSLTENEVEVLVDVDYGELSIGEKRNKLQQAAKGEYSCFIDDDDTVSAFYLKSIFEGIEKGVDCCSLRGVITWDGDNPEIFEHSIRYDSYKTNESATADEIKYERYPLHINVIKTSIAKQFKFPETSHGEDSDWSGQVFKSGLIKTEHYIDKVIYHYQFKPIK